MISRIIGARPWPSGIGPVLTLVDPLCVVLAGALVLPGTEPGPLVLAAFSALVVCRGADLHRSRLVLSVLEDLPALLLAAAAATLVLGALVSTVGLQVGNLADLALFCLLAFAAMVLSRTAVYALVRTLRRAGAIAHPVLIVGAGVIGRSLAEALLARREHGLVPVGIIDSGEGVSTQSLPLPMVGGLDDLERAMSDLEVGDVIFAFPGPPDEGTVAAVRRCVQHHRQVFVVPPFFELMEPDRHRRTEMVRDIAVTRLHRTGTDWPTRRMRRAGDIAVSLGGLLVLSPVLLVSALAVRLETGPGVLVHQTRVGGSDRTFTRLKFRSLRPAEFGADATTWNIDNDSRIGPVGRFLRRTGLDDLPQLVNVLRGEMSLVGPRLERPVRVGGDSRTRARYAEWHEVPGDPTGWARVQDLRGDVTTADPADPAVVPLENRATHNLVKTGLRHPRMPLRRGPTAPRGPRPTAREVSQGEARAGQAHHDLPAEVSDRHEPPLRLDDLTSEHWSWWVDLRIALDALWRVAAHRAGSRRQPGALTAPGEHPRGSDRSATDRERRGSRRG